MTHLVLIRQHPGDVGGVFCLTRIDVSVPLGGLNAKASSLALQPGVFSQDSYPIAKSAKLGWDFAIVPSKCQFPNSAPYCVCVGLSLCWPTSSAPLFRFRAVAEMSPFPLRISLCSQRTPNGGLNHAHPHRLCDYAYGCNGPRWLLFSWMAPAGRDHAAAEIG